MGLGGPALRAVPAIVCAVIAGTCVGCAPQSPDHSSWRDQGYQALSEVSSNVATASLLLEQLQRDRVFGKYAQIVSLNAETNAGQVTSEYITTVLSDAGEVLSQVRIAVVRRDSAAYPRLLRQLTKATRQLNRAEQGIGGRTG